MTHLWTRKRAALTMVSFVVAAAFAAGTAAGAPVLNEFHYDNAGADIGEFVEVVLTGVTSPGAVNLTLYNGNSGSPYNVINVGSTFDSHGTLGDGNRYYSVMLPPNGLQNGAPDGIAVDEGGILREFWSYEGAFTAFDGPAAGVTSTDVGAAEMSSTPPGSSIERVNFGSTWVLSEAANTRGAINSASTPLPGGAFLNEFHYDNAGADTGEFIEVVLTGSADPAAVTATLYNGNGGASYNALNVGSGFDSHGVLGDGNRYYSVVLRPNGLQNGAPDGIAVDLAGTLLEFWSYEGVFTAVDGPAAGMMSTDIAVAEMAAPQGSSVERIDFGATWILSEGQNTRGAINKGLTSDVPGAFVNEFHYDNAGADTGEFIEVVLTESADPAAVTVTLYNGSHGGSYRVINVGSEFDSHGTLEDGNRYYSVATSGIQNGTPDGIAIDIDGELLEFWSYEGVFTASDGPAAGITSTDVGAEERSAPLGSSLQRIGLGDTWLLTEGANTQGAVNVPEPTALMTILCAALGLARRRTHKRRSGWQSRIRRVSGSVSACRTT